MKKTTLIALAVLCAGLACATYAQAQPVDPPERHRLDAAAPAQAVTQRGAVVFALFHENQRCDIKSTPTPRAKCVEASVQLDPADAEQVLAKAGKKTKKKAKSSA